MRIGLDAGHCRYGADTGAQGCGMREELMTRAIVNEISKQLQILGHNVIICNIDKANSVRESLNYRCNKANNSNLDLFVSVHINSGGGTGSEVFTMNGRQLDEGNRILENLKTLGFKNRGIKDGSGLAVVHGTRMKSMLVEVCFIDNQSDINLYKNLGSSRIANAIVSGILNKSMETSKPQTQNSKSNNTSKPNNNGWINMNGKIGICTGDGVRVRGSKDTSNNSNILGHYNKGDKIELYRKEGDWYHIYYRPYKAGYISANYVDMNSPNSNISKPTNDKGKSQLIKRLQQEINKQGFGNISVDGIPGNNTLNSCPTMRKGASGEVTKILQEMLVNMGYVNFLKPYGCDGHFGTGTENAIRQFQKNYGLSSDTVVGRSTWNMIFNKLN